MHLIFGSFDWHSCVHGYWVLARIRHQHPDLAECVAIVSLSPFTPVKVEMEKRHLDLPTSRTFERPHGWAGC